MIVVFLLGQGATIKSVEPVTPYYRAGAWTSVLVQVKSSGPLEGTLIGTTDIPVKFAIPVESTSAADSVYTLPIYFGSGRAILSVTLESGGRVLARGEASGFRLARRDEVVVLADNAAWPRDQEWSLQDRRVVLTRFDLSRVKLWGGEALEGVDAVVGSPEALFPWQALGGWVASAAEFDPGRVRRRRIMTRESAEGAVPRNVRSLWRRDIAVWSLLLYAASALAALIAAARIKPALWSLAAAALVPPGLFLAIFLAAFPGNLAVVHIQAAVVSDGSKQARLELCHAWAPRPLAASIPLRFLSKPLSDEVELTLVTDPSSLTTIASGVALDPRSVVAFAGISRVSRSGIPFSTDGTSLTNGSVGLKRAFAFRDGLVSAALSVAPSQKVVFAWDSEPVRLEGFEGTLGEWLAPEHKAVFAAEDQPIAVRLETGDPPVERQSASTYFVQWLR